MRTSGPRALLAPVAGGFLLLLAASGRAVVPAGSKAFVCDENDDSVTVLDLTSLGTAHTTIPVGNHPKGSALTPAGDRLFVANESDNSVSVIDTATNLVTNTIPLSVGDPWGVAVSVDGTKVYVASRASGAVAILSTASLTQTGTINLPEISSSTAGAEGLALSPGGGKLYVVANFQDVVHVIDTTSDVVIGSPIPVGFNPESAAFNGDGSRLIVVGFGAPTIINTIDDSVVTTSLTDIGTQVEVAVAGNRAVVTNNFNVNTDDPSLDVYDLGLGTFVGSIPLFGTVRGVAISPDGTRAWVTGNGPLPQPPTSEERPGTAGAPESPPGTAAGSSTNGYLVEVDPVNLTYDFNSAGMVDVPGHITGLFPANPLTPIESYFLPKKVTLSLKGAGKDSLALAGFFDDGGAEVDYGDEVTVDAGSVSRTFVLTGKASAKGTTYTYKDGTLSMFLKPNLKGSSRGVFKMKIAKSTLDLDPDEDLDLHFRATGLPDAGGTVTLTAGKYALGKVRGALIAPAFFPSKAGVTANDGKPDVVSLKAGFSTGGVSPEALGSVTVGIGSVFSVTIPGGEFARTGDVFKHTSNSDGQSISVVLDFSRETLSVRAKGYEVGAMPDGTTDILLDPGTGDGATVVTVRMAASGAKRKY